MMKVREVGKFIRDQRNVASLSLRKLSSLAGVSNPYLSQIERGLRRPSAEILKEIAKALSISAETLYIKAGILDERDEDIDTVGAIRRDPTVSEKQKQLLIGLYESFKAPLPVTQRRRTTAPGSAKPTRPTTAKPSTSSKKAKTVKVKTPVKTAARKASGANKAVAARKPVRKTVRKTSAGRPAKKRSSAGATGARRKKP